MENDNKVTEHVENNQESSCCSSGCGCDSAKSSCKNKMLFGLFFLLAAISIFTYKLINNDKSVSSNSSQLYAGTVETVSDSNKVLIDSNKAPVGIYLETMSYLNVVAINQDAVFIYVPAKNDSLVNPETEKEILAAQSTLKEQKYSVGLYTLKANSSDYEGISKQLALPVLLVASKGKGMAPTQGGITKNGILQAFSSTLNTGCGTSGGCGPSGCAPSTPGCK